MSPDTRGSASTTRHIHAGCECRLIPAPVQKIRAILEEGKIPLLRVKTSGTDKLDLGATSYEAGKKYVVVSPISPELVASPISNTIATCQLIRVADRLGRLQVEEVHGELYFWLDPLCVLAPWSEAKPSSEGSIPRTEIYNNAYAILAMDGQFLGIKGHATPEEIESSLRSSEWTARFSRISGNTSNTRILLMAFTGFIDLRAKLDPNTMHSILRGDEAAERAPSEA